MTQTLHIIVRHRRNQHPDYPNQWLDDDRIRSIFTYKEIADICSPLIATAAPVRIHRAGSYDQPPVICCEGSVQAVRPRGHLFEVEFTNARALHVTPTIRPDGKKSWYYTEVDELASQTGDSGTVAEASPSKVLRPNGDPAFSPPKVATPDSGPSADRESPLPPRHFELLQRGTEDWNFARSNKPDVKPDLVGTDLRGVLGKAGPHASVQLARADMRRANMASLAFNNPVLVDASLVGANLTGASWKGARLPTAIELGVSESMRLNLRSANLEGANLSQTRFEKPILYGATFRCATLVDADFSGSKLAGICFDGADMRRANLRATDLTNASFEGTNLAGADLSTATVSKQQVARALTDGDTKLPVDWEF